MTSHTPQSPAGNDLVARLRDVLEAIQYGSRNCIKEHGQKTVNELAGVGLSYIEALTSQQHTELPTPPVLLAPDPPRSGSATREDAGIGGVGRPEPVAGEVEVVAWLTEGAVKGHTVSLYKPFEGGEFNPHRSPPRNPIPEPLVTKSSYDALAAAKDVEIYAVHEAYKDRIDDLQSRRDAGLEAAERQRDALRESLCWAMDEIDVLSNKLCLFAYPQGMKYVEREDQRESYVQAVTTRRAALNDQGGAT